MASLTAAQSRHVKTAEQHLKEAKKLLTTSFTKWSKDYLMAGPEYAKAATAFRLAKQLSRAVDCYLSAVDCAVKSGQAFEVAKYRDLAAQVLCKNKDEPSQRRAAGLYEESLQASLSMEDFIGAADVAQKAAAIWTKIDPARGITLYRDTIEQLQNVGKGMYTLEMYRNAVALAIRAERWAMARDMTVSAISGFVEAGRPPSAVFSWHLTEIILLAKIGDTVALDETFLESLGTRGYGKSDQAEAAEEINRGIKDRDEERLSNVMSLRGMTHGGLHRDVMQLARSMWGQNSAQSRQRASQRASQQQRPGRAPGRNQGTRSELFGKSGVGVGGGGGVSVGVDGGGGGGGGGEQKKKAGKVVNATAAAQQAAATSADDLLDGLDDLLLDNNPEDAPAAAAAAAAEAPASAAPAPASAAPALASATPIPVDGYPNFDDEGDDEDFL
jgi:tetratricopeptide (TPR) repeat protein